MVVKLKRYQYPLKDSEGTYYGHYTIRDDAKPLGFPNERLVAKFDYDTSGHIEVKNWRF